MKWASSWAWLFVIPVIFIFAQTIMRAEKLRATLQFSTSRILSLARKSIRARLSNLPQVLKLAALMCAVGALARPQFADTKVNRNVEGIDIMIALDVSDSMEIEDMKPVNRITAAKTVIKNFIKGRTSDRIGLIIFAGESYTRTPLTLDYDVLLKSLENVTTENMKDGTAIGVALANGVARLKESTAKNRILILLTDGESNTGTIDPDTATDIAKGYGIKVYTIGVGVNGESQLPVWTVDAFGRKVKHYQPIHSTVNEELLKHIADETGAQTFRAVDGDALKNVFATIDSLEKTKIQVNEYVKFTELFNRWLLWAFVFYLAQLVLSQTLLRRVP